MWWVVCKREVLVSSRMLGFSRARHWHHVVHVHGIARVTALFGGTPKRVTTFISVSYYGGSGVFGFAKPFCFVLQFGCCLQWG